MALINLSSSLSGINLDVDFVVITFDDYILNFDIFSIDNGASKINGNKLIASILFVILNESYLTFSPSFTRYLFLKKVYLFFVNFDEKCFRYIAK